MYLCRLIKLATSRTKINTYTSFTANENCDNFAFSTVFMELFISRTGNCIDCFRIIPLYKLKEVILTLFTELIKHCSLSLS